MYTDGFPLPREAADSRSFGELVAVSNIVDELKSYPAGIPIEQIINYLSSDYYNWHDILLQVLDTDDVTFINGCLMIVK